MRTVTLVYLVITITPYGSREQYLVKVGTQEVEKTEAKHGSTLQTFLYDVGRNLDQVNSPLTPVPFM